VPYAFKVRSANAVRLNEPSWTGGRGCPWRAQLPFACCLASRPWTSASVLMFDGTFIVDINVAL
jgi:hypothetical protein